MERIRGFQPRDAEFNSRRRDHLCSHLTKWNRWLPSQGRDTSSNLVGSTNHIYDFERSIEEKYWRDEFAVVEETVLY